MKLNSRQISNPKPKNPHQHHLPHSSLLPYPHLITLLLPLFVVLFPPTSLHAQKFHQISKVFSAIC
ncbi:flagellar motor protein MotB, partial [Siminovitchia fortis]|uniref:flagellar motor protein MotB n=1 Tax=Siminovitchia fortis TaxID=254758 RepID=UPI0028CBC0CA